MERNELLREWTKTLATKMKTADFSPEQQEAVLEVLGSVFEVGRQTGADEEKLRIQLNKLGEPTGNVDPGTAAFQQGIQPKPAAPQPFPVLSANAEYK